MFVCPDPLLLRRITGARLNFLLEVGSKMTIKGNISELFNLRVIRIETIMCLLHENELVGP